jgi:hypothetical protein
MKLLLLASYAMFAGAFASNKAKIKRTECEIAADCGSGSYSCLEGSCFYDGKRSVTIACETDNDCPEDMIVCASGKCADPFA